MLDDLLTEGPVPSSEGSEAGVVVGDYRARWAHGAEAQLATSVLRRRNRWQRAGFTHPPTDTLSGPLTVALPTKERDVRPRAGWVFAGEKLVASFVDYGFGSDRDPKRILWVFELRAPFSGTSPGIVFAAAALPKGAVLIHQDIGDELFGALTEHGAQKMGDAWLQLTKEHIPKSEPWTAPPPLSVEDTESLAATGWGSVGPILWTHRPQGPEIVLRDPADAHGQLIRGASPWRSLFYPAAGDPEDVEVLVVGGGIAGVTAAYRCAPRKTVILERQDRMGGTAASGDGVHRAFGMGAHYECDLWPHFGEDLHDHYETMGWVQRRSGTTRFVAEEHYARRGELVVLPNGQVLDDGWLPFLTADTAGFRKRLEDFRTSFPLPSRTALPEIQALQKLSLHDWIQKEGFSFDGLAIYALEAGMRDDYGAGTRDVSAFAGLHFMLCRPYLWEDVNVFAPPEGLAYFVNDTLRQSPHVETRLHHMVRSVTDRGDHVEVIALDLQESVTRRFHAKHVVYAAPKKAVPYTFPAERFAFPKHNYAAWITVTMELKDMAEVQVLEWINHIHEPSGIHMGLAWHNHHKDGQPPILTHYLVFPPGRRNHMRAWAARPRELVQLCTKQLIRLLGRDPTPHIERITIQKLGHAMPTPKVGALFTNPNAHRISERIAYAGVDTGRLPLMSEAIDSAFDAVRALGLSDGRG